MQGRNRSPVEAMRPGMGRVSPEESSYHKSQGFYGGAGSRSFRRGGGGGYRRGPPKPHFPYPPPPPPPPPPQRRKIDVLMEAGRLAAEYLVAKGVLPPGSLPRSGANGGVQEFKGRERENVGYEGRVSALNRLGNSDGGAGKRRYGGGGNNSDEYDNVGTRNSSVARARKRRVDHYTLNSHGSDWRRETKRSGQWMDRSRSFGDNPSNNGSGNNIGDFSDGDFAPGFRQSGFEDSGRGARVSGAVVEAEELPKNDDVGDESDTDTSDFPDDVVLKDCFSRAKKASLMETEGALNKEVRTAQAMTVKTANGKGDDRSSTEMEELSGNSTVQGHVAVVREGSEQGTDLLRSCGFAKVPTRPRTPMGNRSLKVSRGPEIAETEKTYQQSIIENGKITDTVSDAEPKLEVEKSSINRSPIKELTDLTHNSVCSMPENPASLTVQHIEKPKNQTSDLTTDVEGCNKIFPVSEISQLQNQSSSDMAGSSVCDTNSKHYTKLLTLPERSAANNPVKLSHKSSFGAPLVDLDSKKKDGFPLQDALTGGIKRPRDWSSSISLHDNDYVQMHNSSACKSYAPGLNIMHDEEMIESIDQKKLVVDAELLPKTEQVTSMEVKKEKQFVPNSFKICDLNLIEAHDITEIPDDRVPENTSGNSLSMETGTLPSVEFGLSVGRNNNGTNLYGQCSNENKVIQVIDLENDSSAKGCACENSRPKSEAMYSNLDNLLNQTDNGNTVDLPDIHDGYGLPISDLLGPGIPTCPPISGEGNSLQQGMNLLDESLPCDDDSIYVSLSELPLGFMDAWDPPPQEYGELQQRGGPSLQ